MVPALFLMPLLLFLGGESDNMLFNKINLPERVDGWRIERQPRRIDKTNIFDYMNGAGELYLSYHFDHLMVYDYTSDSDNDIRVELYQMKGSRDAFGLLSLDWGGEPVELDHLGSGKSVKSRKSIIPSSRALYGKGLLRAWSDNIYIRITALRETPGIKETILKLGKIITTGRANPPAPELLKVIKPPMGSSWAAKRDRTAYFYSHLVLNTFFYLSHENILNLNHSTEALIVTFEREQKDREKNSVPLLVIKYPDYEHASAAMADFADAYLPDRVKDVTLEKGGDNQDFFHIEDGWLGYKLVNRYLALVFECPDRESGVEILSYATLK
jgi:hypothetical protein